MHISSRIHGIDSLRRRPKVLNALYFQIFKRKPHKMVKHTQTIRRQQQTNCLSVFVHSVGLALKNVKKTNNCHSYLADVDQ